MGEKIKERRIALKMTQEQLADKMGVTQGAVQQWESNRANPALNKLPLLSKVLKTTIDNLMS